MEQLTKGTDDNFDDYFPFLEDLYGAAVWALRYGASKESLLGEIEDAIEVHEESLQEDGWLIGPDTSPNTTGQPAGIS